MVVIKYKDKSVEFYINKLISYYDNEDGMGINTAREFMYDSIKSDHFNWDNIYIGKSAFESESFSEEIDKLDKAYWFLHNKGYKETIKQKLKIEKIQYNFYTMSGIYEIVNIKNNKRYIGMTNGVYGRWQQHKAMLKKNQHHCKNLQQDYNEFGEECFKFNVIEVVKDYDEQRFKERYWWEYSQGEKYNLPDNMMRHSDYTIEKLQRRVNELENKLKIS